MTLGLDVLVQLVMAAITTEPCSSCCATVGSTPTPPSLAITATAALLAALLFAAGSKAERAD